MLGVLLLVMYLVVLSAVVLLKKPIWLVNISLVVLMFFACIWMVSVYMLQTSFGSSVDFARFVFVVGGITVAGIVWFIYEVLYAYSIRMTPRKYLILYILFLLLGSCAVQYTPIIIKSVSQVPDMLPNVNYGEAIWSYQLYVILSLVYIIIAVIQGWRYTKGTAHNQMRVIAVSVGVASIIAPITNLLAPMVFNNTQIALFMPISVMVLLSGLTYAIVRHKLFDIRLAAVRTIAYVLSLGTLSSIYFSLAYLVSATILKDSGAISESIINPFNIFLSLALAFIFQPIKQFFDKITNRIFFRDGYDVEEFIARLGEVLTSTVVLGDLLKLAADEIRHTLNASTVRFVIYRPDGDSIVRAGEQGSNFTKEQYAQIKEYIESSGTKAIVIDDFEAEVSKTPSAIAANMLYKKNIAIVLPLRRSEGVVGYLLLGQHKGRGYSKQDIKVLDTIADELIIAIQNAKSVEQVQDINKNLEQRIEDATRELRLSNSKLQKLDKAKDEFISLTSHQLRTPLTSVKGYISMVLEGDAGKVTPQQRTLLEEAFNSSERMVHLIGDFLNVSRIQTGKFVIETQMVDLREIVKQEVEVARPNAESRSIRIEYRTPKVFPLVPMDEAKTRQVIMNFIDNAVYYSHAGGVIKIRLSVEDGEAVLTVKDSGIGVPEAVQSSLFGKFFRADNARKQRPDGTGIGLYLSKKIIVAQGGSIIFESKENVGSTFGFRLPIQKPSQLGSKTSAD